MQINVSDYRNVFLCGDIHGELLFLLLALKELGYDSDYDLILTTGDTIDRGSDSLKSVLYFLDHKLTKNDKPSAKSTRGNHEDFGIDICYAGNKDWESEWYRFGGDWTKKYNEEFLKDLFSRVNEEFPLYFDIFFKDKHIVASHAAIPGYNYDLIKNYPDKELVKRWLLHKEERFPVDEEDEIASLPVSGVDLSIHGHTIVPQPYLYKNRLYIDTGCFKDAGIEEGVKNSLTILKLNESEGVSIQSFKRNSFLKDIEWVSNDAHEKTIENELNRILDTKEIK